MHFYLNGHIQTDTQPGIPHNDRGFLLGDGVFETIALIDETPLFLEQHLHRLLNSLAIMQIPLPKLPNNLEPIIQELLALNHIQTPKASARLTVSRGPGPRGLTPPAHPSPTVLLTVSAYTPAPSKPYALTVASIRRNEHSPLSRIKSLCYGDNILGRMEAVQKGADDALFLNTQSHVTGTSMANIFIVKNNVLKTPHLDDGVLPGIMLAQVLAEAKAQGRAIAETQLTVEDCQGADEMFITNVLMGRQQAYLI